MTTSPPRTPSNSTRSTSNSRSTTLAITCLSVVLFGSILGPYSQPTETYFSSSRNLFNQLFVKYGWAWTSLLFITATFFLSRSPSPSSPQPSPRPHTLPPLFRYAVATVYWYAITQSFFGPSILDRLYTLTGGACTSVSSLGDDGDNQLRPTSYAGCKRAGGRWQGGHDVSGHCLLLIHATMFLYEELIAAGVIARLRASSGGVMVRRGATVATYGLMGVWGWMLLMTAVYYHNFLEKLSGTFFGLLGWFLIYVVL